MAGAATRNRPETREPIAVHAIEVRARYPECDPMGVVHHSVYPVWFEMGRTEMLRAAGGSYRDLEAAGVFLAVVHLEVRYRRPARYDDVLRLETSLLSPGPVKIEHAYRLLRGDELLVEGRTTLACLDRSGRAQPVPGTSLAPTVGQPGTSLSP
jgi:acyl-CoA thioester hydrolase